MNELQPLDIVDDRTSEQVRADGDERWPDGSPYILNGVCCACGATDVDEMHMCLAKLDEPALCYCGYQMAYWSVNNTPVCDYDIRMMASMNSDNEAFFAPALVNMKQRQEVQDAG